MPLNIYIISHPIISILSTQIISSLQTNNKINEPIYSEINFLLIYELLRKWIKVKNIYIKDINKMKEISMFNPKESYILFTNIEKYYNIINHLKILMPKLSLRHIDIDKNNNDYTKIYFNSKNRKYPQNNKIIIVQKILNNDAIIHFINQLINEYKIHINSIKIICIACHKKVLEAINTKYSNLDIYTTKIINT
uniref:hypothetical protein n=1 Tax=Hypnea pseudomusciformis TaxID=1545697 RepID=UPI0027D9ECAA|nr:hypothetical protein P4C74_pgp005 [Hypnea pseudomusciformis]WCH55228.1 hypothetical protein [Hypnea pseudomusciformis]WCH56821.1 hypothetical protein [Hypnea pseudomusciformis]